MKPFRSLVLAFLLALSSVPAFATAGDITATQTKFQGQGTAYTQYVVTAVLNDTTAVETTLTIPFSTIRGGAILKYAAATGTEVITATLRPSAYAATDTPLFTNAQTMAGAAALASVNVPLWSNLSTVQGIPAFAIPPGTYVLRFVSSATSNATVAATLLFVHWP